MFDVRSHFLVMVVTYGVLAASLWFGMGRRFRAGMAEWTLALCAQAFAMALYAARGVVPDVLTNVVANTLMVVSMSLCAAALGAFRGIGTPPVLHASVAVIVAGLCLILIDNFAARVATLNFLLACSQVGLIAYAWKPIEGVLTGTRKLLVGSLFVATVSFVVRAVASVLDPAPYFGFLTPSAVQSGALLANYAAMLVASLAFLLMQRDRADHAAQQLASLDPLTGAYNRRTFAELGQMELSRARRFDSPLSVILFDLDHFKRVNDTHGHVVGDHVLRRFAEVVRAELRKEDILVRYGGEEFCVLLPDVPGTGAVTLASRIRKSLADQPLQVDGLDVPLTTSAGVAARIDEGPGDLDRLVARADEALYIAKQRGRNRVAAVSPGQPRVA